MAAASRTTRIIQGGVGLALIVSGLGHFGIVRGWSADPTSFGIAVGSLSTTAGACLVALSARPRQPSRRE